MTAYWQPPAPLPPPAAPTPPKRGGLRSLPRRAVVGIVAFLVLLVGVAIGSAAGTTKTVDRTVAGPTTTLTEVETATATVSVTATPTRVVVTTRPVTATVVRTATVTYTPPAVAAFSDGTFVVGSDVKPGVYHTDGNGDGSNTVGCYWARLSSLDTADIIDNNLVSGPTTIEVRSSDKALETSGGCSWTKTG